MEMSLDCGCKAHAAPRFGVNNKTNKGNNFETLCKV
jgi:hypothetical protein